MSKAPTNKNTASEPKTKANETESAKPNEYPKRNRIRINGRFLLVLSLIMIALGGGTYALHSVQMERSAESLLTLAGEAEAAGQSRDAINYLQQYLRFRPADYDKKIRMANLAESMSRDTRQLYFVAKLLEDVLRNDPGRADEVELRDRVIEHSMTIGQFHDRAVNRDALAHIDILLKREDQRSPERQAELTRLQGLCHWGLGDYRKSLSSYLKAIVISPTAVESYIGLATVIQYHPEVIPFQEDLQKSASPRYSPVLIAVFPKRQVQANSAVEARKPLFKDGGPITQSGTDVRSKNSERTISAIYNLISKACRPKHKVDLALMSYFAAKQDLETADLQAESALTMAGSHPDVLHAVSGYYLLRAQQAALKFRGSSTSASIEQWLGKAEKLANLGLGPDAKDNLRFQERLVDVEFQRVLLERDQPKKQLHRTKALGLVNEALKDLEEKRVALKSVDLKRLKELRLREISLKTLELELLVDGIRKDDGSVNQENLDVYNQKLQQLGQIGGRRDNVELFNVKSSMAQQKWHEAIEILQGIRRWIDTNPNANLRRQVDMALAECYQQLRNPLAKIQILEKGLANDPFWHEGRKLLAAALADRGRLEQAVIHYRFLVQQNIAGSWVGLLGMQLGRMRQIAEDRRNYAGFDRNLKVAERKEKNAPAVAILRVRFALMDTRLTPETRIQQAAAHLRTARKANPDSLELLVTEAEFLARRPDRDAATRFEEALKLLRSHKPKRPAEDAAIQASIARIAALMKPELAVKELAALVEESKNLPRDNRATVLQTIAGSYGAINHMDKCLITWEAIADLFPRDLQAQLAIAALKIGKGNGDTLSDILKRVRDIDGKTSGWAYYYEAVGQIDTARRKVKKAKDQLKSLPASVRETRSKDLAKSIEKHLTEAQKLLEAGQQQQPDWPEFPERLGLVFEMLGNKDEAFRNYQRCIDLGGASEIAFTFVANYLTERRRFDEADQVIKKAQQINAGATSAERIDLTDKRASLTEIAFQIALQKGDFDEAKRLVPEKARGYSQKVLRADILKLEYRSLSEDEKKSSRGEALKKKSEDLYEDALKEASNIPEAWIYHVLHFARQDREKEALAKIQEAEQTLPKDSRNVTVARCYAILGKDAEATKFFEEAVKEAPDDMSRRLLIARYYASRRAFAKAIPHLKLVEDSTHSMTTQKAVARHLRLLVSARGGKYADIAKAVAQIPSIEKANIQDLYTLVKIHERSSLKKDREFVISILEEIDRRRPLNSADRFTLARLYEKARRWEDARKTVEELLKKDPQNRLLLGWFAVEILQNEKHTPKVLEDVDKRIVTLKKVDPGSLSTIMAEAQLLIAKGKSADAEKLLETGIKSVVKNQKKLPVKDSATLLLVAKFTEKNKLHQLTDKLLQHYGDLSETPSAILARATFLGRIGRHAEALDICVKAPKTVKPESIVVAAVKIVSTGQPTAADLKTAQTLVETAAKADPKSPEMLWQLAAIQTATGNTAEGEALYRQLYDKNPQSVAILNNYAWLLAMRNQRLAEALAMMDVAIEIAGPVSTLLDTRAVVSLRLGRYQNAITDLNQAVDEDPEPLHLMHLAAAYLASGNRDAAIKAFADAEKAGLSRLILHRLEQTGYEDLKQKLAASAK